MSRRLVIEADGGSRGNPGPAGFGALVRDAATGAVLAEVAEAIGRATNNVAEYRGLIAGLAAAQGIAPDASVEARMDSKLVVEQMSGRWRIKHADLRPLAEEARAASAGFAEVTYVWVPRADNAHADALANEAMDAAAEGRPVRLDAPPGGAADSAAGAAAEPSAEPAGGAARAPRPPATGWSAPDTAPTRLVLLRHGETTMSAEQRFAGTGDIDLTGTGHDQARAAARHLAGSGIDVVVSSPLRRARDTAEPVAAELSLPVEVEEDLRETDFGAWEGMTFSEVRRSRPDELQRWLADTAAAPEGGESFAAVAERVAEARDKLLARYTGRTVLVVSHVTPIKVLLQQALLAPPEALFRMHLDVGCLSLIDCFSDGPTLVRSLNDTGHLGPAAG
ncbi:bifunctional RNase H/acid phosphatase [Streptomonospora wellingtoniae]|uniref:Bifunctional RNase H/acid phosphatase n=1 Tax=Streptomonospora wellingtoniae TaxID=3075544 RepID=A0ABU2KUR8_9ACTN|nr:bifunctional RNase H/acid phosphatase [Streptomonospora sp. DSM 45055]MDT0303003.1 bifunctional RNase H/acid phosphatase [Streptomonospora sp. DSM 45055]